MTSGASDLALLLQSLPDLTELDVECGCGDVEFMLSLPRVVKLSLRPRGILGPADLSRIVRTLQRCSQITDLNLHCLTFSSAQLGEILPALPRLSTLRLVYLDDLTSLRFLATEALAASLTTLSISGCYKLPADEMVHLLGLRRLRYLAVSSMREPLSLAQKAQLRAVQPSALL